MTVSQLIKEINKSDLSIEDLSILNELIVRKVKAMRKEKNQAAKNKLTIGMEVKVNHPKLMGRTFELVEIRRTKAVVRPFGERIGGYTVPLSLVEVV